MMGFFDKVKKTFGSKKEDKSQNSVHAESIDKPASNEKIRNFKYLDDLIHSGAKEIVLDSDIVLSDDEKSGYEDGIRIDVDNLVIDAAGHSIDAINKTRIFDIYSKVTIKNLTLKNGYAIDGGAINVQEDGGANIVGCQFQENTASRNGGAICNKDSELTITKSEINNNIAEVDGGAIFNGGELTITESTFTVNTSKFGGVIANTGSLIITKTPFTGNAAITSGGAIFNDGELTITESVLKFNTSVYDGGAIENWGKISISESTLQENIANHDGGLICNLGGELTITDSALNENIAKRYGGSICNSGGELTVTGSALNENRAQYGGAIFNRDSLTIRESTLTGNVAQEAGGAICLEDSRYESNNCIFKDNKPDDVYEK